MSSKLKILLIIQPCCYGSGRHVLELAKGLVKLGHALHLIYAPNVMDATFDEGLKELRNLNVKTFPLVMIRKYELRDLSHWVAIRKYIKSAGPFDIIHSHAIKASTLARLSGLGLSGSHFNTPHAISTMHLSNKIIKKWLYVKIEQFLAHLSDGIIAVSQEEYLHILDIGISQQKLFLVPNGIDLSSPQMPDLARRGIGIEDSDILIGFVGRLVPQKAPEVLLKAFANLIHRFPNARLAMVGEGPLEPELRAEAKSLNIEEKVLWLGRMNGPAIVPAFDIFALSSRYEGHPYVLLEAMAAGLPIVATSVGGVKSTMLDGVNGYVVPPNSPELFAEALVPLLSSKDLRSKMGEASKEQCKNFSFEKMVNETVTIYETFVTNGSNAEITEGVTLNVTG